MKISLYFKNILLFTIDTRGVNEQSFPDLMRQFANILLGQWKDQTPQVSHRIDITETP
jgi:hypothetical protein